MTNFLVTGGTGFLGSYLVKSLIKNNNRVTVFDNNFRGKLANIENIENIENLKFIEGDIRNLKDISKAIDNIDVIYHLAFINGTKTFYENPVLVLDVGIKGILNLIEFIPNSNVKKIILASSSEVYQTPNSIPTNEKVQCLVPDVKNPRYSYGGAKIINEILLLHHHKLEKIKKVIFRPHNLYGPNMGWGHVIPQLIEKIYISSNKFRDDECEIKIQGSGKETRSYCFISDAINALNVIEENGQNNEIYNIGNNEEISILNIIKIMQQILGIKIFIKNDSLSDGSVLRRCPDITKIKKLGFENLVNLNEGLNIVIDWYKKYLLDLND